MPIRKRRRRGTIVGEINVFNEVSPPHDDRIIDRDTKKSESCSPRSSNACPRSKNAADGDGRPARRRDPACAALAAMIE